MYKGVHCVAEATRGGFFAAHIPARYMWMERMKKRRSEPFPGWVEAWRGVFCKELCVTLSFRLLDHCSVCSVEAAGDSRTATKGRFFQRGEHSL